MDNSTIVVLKGPDRVRKRPAVIFGSDGIKGATNAIKLLIDIFATEAYLGFSKQIDVSICKDNSVNIRSYDRGFVLDETIIDGRPHWHQDFCELFAGPREPDKDYYFSLGQKHNNLFENSETISHKYKTSEDHSFYLCSVQYASRYMHVESTRDGIKKTLDFKDGFSASDLQKESSNEKNNTFIRFLLESDVFGEEIILPQKEIADYLKEIAIAIPGFKCNIFDERVGFATTYHYPNGAQDYISEISKDYTALYCDKIEAAGKDRYNRDEYSAVVKFTVGFANDVGETLCLHNHKKLAYGGNHLNAIKERLMHSVNWKFIWDFSDELSNGKEKCYADRERFELSFEDIKDNIILIVESVCDENATRYETANQQAIVNRMITDMAHDLISDDFDYYLKQNHDAILSILKKCQEKRRQGK